MLPEKKRFLKDKGKLLWFYVDKNPHSNCYHLLLFQIEASEFWYNSTLLEGFFLKKKKLIHSASEQVTTLLLSDLQVLACIAIKDSYIEQDLFISSFWRV